VKHLKIIFNALKGVLLTLILVSSAPVAAQEDIPPMDSVEFSLLTCQPHDEVYSLYGHTAIRYHELRPGGLDWAFNYGVFDFKKPHFVARFVFGLTDYELGAFPFRLFCEEYRYFGSMVEEQILNLTAEEKALLFQSLDDNLQPGNRIYRYNYFYNNCTTKARDIIEQCINGEVVYSKSRHQAATYRSIIHDMTQQNPWSRFGNDLLLGVMADRQIGTRQQEFLPSNLMYDFDHASIVTDGASRPLVKEKRTTVPAGAQKRSQGFPLTPTQCAWLFLLLHLTFTIVQWKKRHTIPLWDIVLMLTAGIPGIILTLMLFSQHPTVSLNLQIVLLNPLPFFFLWKVIRQKNTRYWHITAVLCVLFLAGGFLQSYAEGIWVLALCLLIQSILHIKKSNFVRCYRFFS